MSLSCTLLSCSVIRELSYFFFNLASSIYPVRSCLYIFIRCFNASFFAISFCSSVSTLFFTSSANCLSWSSFKRRWASLSWIWKARPSLVLDLVLCWFLLFSVSFLWAYSSFSATAFMYYASSLFAKEAISFPRKLDSALAFKSLFSWYFLRWSKNYCRLSSVWRMCSSCRLAYIWSSYLSRFLWFFLIAS